MSIINDVFHLVSFRGLQLPLCRMPRQPNSVCMIITDFIVLDQIKCPPKVTEAKVIEGVRQKKITIHQVYPVKHPPITKLKNTQISDINIKVMDYGQLSC